MRVITLKSKYLKWVKEGRKCQTIRKNSLYYQGIKTGDIGYVTNYREKIKIKVTKVYLKTKNELTEEEAILNGFFSLKELLPFLGEEKLKIIRFETI